MAIFFLPFWGFFMFLSFTVFEYHGAVNSPGRPEGVGVGEGMGISAAWRRRQRLGLWASGNETEKRERGRA